MPATHQAEWRDCSLPQGFGPGYTTPFGPIQLHLGFPFDPPAGGDPWQVRFSVGQFF